MILEKRDWRVKDRKPELRALSSGSVLDCHLDFTAEHFKIHDDTSLRTI
jgi:hypothetical protein